MLVHTDPRLQKAIVLSFPRDLWVDIPGRGIDKINSAFAGGLEGGGAQLVAKTVEELSGLKINHLLYVDLAGFQGIVDALGGVTMCIPTAMTDPLTGLDVQAGCQTLDGFQALAYVRTRHQPCDLIPDFARISRQQQFLRAVLNRLLSPSEIAKAPSLIRPVARNLVTTKGFDLGGRRLSRRADRGHLDRRGGVPRGARASAASRERCPSCIPDPSRTRSSRASARASRSGPGRRPPVDGAVRGEHRRAVVDHDSGGTADEVEQILSDAGFDISPEHRRLRDVRLRRQGLGHRVQARASERCRGRAEVLPRPAAHRGAGERAPRHPGRRVHLGGASTWSPSAAGRPPPIASAAVDAADARARPGRRRGVAPAAAHPHEREAADPRRGGADPVPRARGDPRRRHHRGRHRDRARRATRSAPRSGTASRWGLSRHLHPAGRSRSVSRTPSSRPRDFVARRAVPDVPRATTCCWRGSAGSSGSSNATRPDAQIFLAQVAEPEQFGVAVLEGDRVVRLVEKPKTFVSRPGARRRVPVRRFDPGGVRDTLEPSWRGEFEITEAIQWLIDHGKTVRAEMVDGWWKDTGTAGGPARGEPGHAARSRREPAWRATWTRARRWTAPSGSHAARRSSGPTLRARRDRARRRHRGLRRRSRTSRSSARCGSCGAGPRTRS